MPYDSGAWMTTDPATLAIDKLSAADIVEGMLNEDRKMLLAVQRERVLREMAEQPSTGAQQAVDRPLGQSELACEVDHAEAARAS